MVCMHYRTAWCYTSCLFNPSTTFIMMHNGGICLGGAHVNTLWQLTGFHCTADTEGQKDLTWSTSTKCSTSKRPFPQFIVTLLPECNTDVSERSTMEVEMKIKWRPELKITGEQNWCTLDQSELWNEILISSSTARTARSSSHCTTRKKDWHYTQTQCLLKDKPDRHLNGTKTVHTQQIFLRLGSERTRCVVQGGSAFTNHGKIKEREESRYVTEVITEEVTCKSLSHLFASFSLFAKLLWAQTVWNNWQQQIFL